MIFVAALVALHIGVFAWAAIDDVAAGAALPLVECVLALAGLALPNVRRGMLDAIVRYWPAALAFAILIGAAIYGANASGEHMAHSQAWTLVGFGMGALCAVGAALSAGRRQLQNALLIGAVALGALAVIQQMQSARALFAAPEEAAALFALLAALAVYCGIDALNPPAAQPLERRTTRAQRLFLPTAAFLSALIGLVLTGSLMSITALGAALAALAGCLALRERRRGVGLLLLGALGLVSLIGAALLLFLAERARDGALAPHISLTIAFGAAALAWIAFIVVLSLSPDRRRRPSRGLAVALAGGAVLAFAGSGGAAPVPFALLALTIGLAAAHADALAHVSSERRSSDRT